MTPTQLKTKRHALNMTQRELAESIGARTKAVQNWEQGVCAVPSIAVFAILRLTPKGGNVKLRDMTIEQLRHKLTRMEKAGNGESRQAGYVRHQLNKR